MVSGFLTLLSFFTRVPIGNWVEYDEENFKKALWIYVGVGLVVGLLLMSIWLFGNIFNNSMIKGLMLTIFYTIITGGIHLDGYADTIDGLFSGRTGERIFEIMSDSHVGSFGVLGLIFVILSQFVLFSASNVSMCFLMPAVGRTAVVLSCCNKHYAKKSKGMGTIFVENINAKIVFTNIFILFFVCIFLQNRVYLSVGIVVTLICSYFVSKWIENKIGGMTGDTCGFVTEVTQIIFMTAVLAAERLI